MSSPDMHGANRGAATNTMVSNINKNNFSEQKLYDSYKIVRERERERDRGRKTPKLCYDTLTVVLHPQK